MQVLDHRGNLVDARDVQGALDHASADMANPEFIQQQQRWLMFLRHCAKCQKSETECPLQLQCRDGKQLWQHINHCASPQCEHPRCSASKQVLTHHQNCQSPNCPICHPVNEYFRKIKAQQMQREAEHVPPEAQMQEAHAQDTPTVLSSQSLSALKAAADAATQSQTLGSSRSQLHLDLCDKQIDGELPAGTTIMMPPNVTLRNGEILLPDNAKICFDGCNALLSKLRIHGAHSTACAVEIRGPGCVRMEDVRVEGGGGGIGSSGAVRVDGSGKGDEGGWQLSACRSTFHCSKGSGLVVAYSGAAVLSEGTVCDGNGACGWLVAGAGSTLEAHSGSSASGNTEDNAHVFGGARAVFTDCRLEGSKEGVDLRVVGRGSSAIASGYEKSMSVSVQNGAKCSVEPRS